MSFRSVLTGIKQWYNDLNPATLTGAIDVIVVEQDDGTFVSSPFHVRFGKMGVLKAKEKIVSQQFFCTFDLITQSTSLKFSSWKFFFVYFLGISHGT